MGALNIVEALDVRGIVFAGSDFLRHDEIYLDAVTDAINRYRRALVGGQEDLIPDVALNLLAHPHSSEAPP